MQAVSARYRELIPSVRLAGAGEAEHLVYHLSSAEINHEKFENITYINACEWFALVLFLVVSS
jgi:hypothetical protein